MIIQCGCTMNSLGGRNGAEYQDAQYGKGNRVANPLQKDKKGFRCTVCGKTHTTSQPKDEKKKEEKKK